MFGTEPPWILGILNVTPDSFSDGKQFIEENAALKQAAAFTGQGAAAVDIGGEATGPGTSPISAAEELGRIEGIIKKLAPRMFLSVDTYHSSTARRALELGARMINDVSALRADPEMRNVIAEHKAWVVLMHSKESPGHPHATESHRDYQRVTREIAEFLLRQVDYALRARIPFENIIIDPGMGKFLSHDPKYSWLVLEHLDELKHYGLSCPVLISTSRKSFLGGEIAERDLTSQLTALIAVQKGAAFIRTHNVKMASECFEVWRKAGSPVVGD